MSPLETLKAARALISNPRNWCRYTLKKRLGPNEYVYCALGAIQEAEKMNPASVWYELGKQVRIFGADTGGIEGIAFFNNTHSHEDVLRLFDDTIARLEEQETTSIKEVEVEQAHNYVSVS